MTNFDFSPLWISIRTSAVATLITFILGVYFAKRMLSYQGKFKNLFDAILSVSVVLPPTVMGFLLLVIFGKHGPIGSLMIFLVDSTILFSWKATVVAAASVSFPLMYKTALGAFCQVDENILNAARTLGVSERRIFRKILLPLAWPGVASGIVLSFARSLGEFGATLMLAGNIPGRTQTIPMAIYFAAEAGDMKRAGIWVVVIILMSIIMMMLTNRFEPNYQKKSRKNGAKR